MTCVARSLVLALLAGVPSMAQPPEPIDVGQTERVQVQYVLVDLVVTDARGRTVPGLEIENFDVVLDGRRIEPATLDVDCPLGAAADPRAGRPLDRADPAHELPATAPGQIVLALDYYHIIDPVESIRELRSALRDWPARDERKMLVTLGQTLRVEAGFTQDRRELFGALDRVERDASLYAGHHDHLTERRLFSRLLSLMDLMETVPGRKVVVLFSGPLHANGWTYDPYYRRLAAMATRSRTRIYPVDSRGLFAGIGAIGGPPLLARIATETGGRLTRNTNKLGLGYARARRDLGCTYTLGFRDPHPKPDKNRRVDIYIRGRRGLRVSYPSGYVLRSAERRVESMLRTATMAPEMFEPGALDAEAFVVAPVSRRRWDVVLAIDAPSAPERGKPPWRLGGIVRTLSGTPRHRFERTVARADPPPGDWLYERMQLEPGAYRVNLYFHRPGMDLPQAMASHFRIPRIPRDRTFLVGPMLVATRTLEERGRPLSIAPLPLTAAGMARELSTLTRVCYVGREGSPEAEVARRLEGPAGEVIHTFDAEPTGFERHRRVQCRQWLDRWPASTLDPGHYLFRVDAVDAEGRPGRSVLSFTIDGS